MAIEYDSERKAYVDSETGDYVTLVQGDREYFLTNYLLWNARGKCEIGALVQRYAAEYEGDLDHVTHWQYIVLNAWRPDVCKPKNRDILDETDPRIRGLWDFIVADHWGPFPVKEHVRLELVVDYDGKKSIGELRHWD